MPVLTNSFNANPNLFPDSCDDDEGVDEETFTAVAALAGIFGAIGMAAGSVVPGAGTLIGGVLGGVVFKRE